MKQEQSCIHADHREKDGLQYLSNVQKVFAAQRKGERVEMETLEEVDEGLVYV